MLVNNEIGSRVERTKKDFDVPNIRLKKLSQTPPASKDRIISASLSTTNKH
jgi:hypothetical protein